MTAVRVTHDNLICTLEELSISYEDSRLAHSIHKHTMNIENSNNLNDNTHTHLGGIPFLNH